MTLAALRAGWDEFWFGPRSPLAMAFVRICFGLTTLVYGVRLWPELDHFYGDQGLLSHLPEGSRLFQGLPGGSHPWLVAFWVMFMGAAVCVTVGLGFRLAALQVAVAICLLHARTPAIVNGGDVVWRLTALYLVFSEGGRALSMDRLRRVARGEETHRLAPGVPCWQRVLQVQMALIYLASFWWKAQGHRWIDGTAIYYVSRVAEFHRFPVPYLFEHLWTIRLLTWGTLLIEFLLGTAVWVREWRYPVLVAGLALHLGMDYALNIPMFQWTMLSCYPAFLRASDVERGIDTLRRRLSERSPVPIDYDPHHPLGCRAAELLRVLDVRHQLEWRPAPAVEGGLRYSEYNGAAAFRAASRQLPTGWLGRMVWSDPPSLVEADTAHDAIE